jgi:hypothetical protein
VSSRYCSRAQHRGGFARLSNRVIYSYSSFAALAALSSRVQSCYLGNFAGTHFAYTPALERTPVLAYARSSFISLIYLRFSPSAGYQIMSNFGTFGNALLVMFQLLVQNNWYDL